MEKSQRHGEHPNTAYILSELEHTINRQREGLKDLQPDRTENDTGLQMEIPVLLLLIKYNKSQSLNSHMTIKDNRIKLFRF